MSIDSPRFDSLSVRPLVADDLPAVRSTGALAFGEHISDAAWERDSAALELDRCRVATIDDVVVGHSSAYSFTMVVPTGRTMPVAGVTWVAVNPAHRRRGVLRALMNEQLEQLAGSGESVAVLTASEPVIYGRFGYGLASRKSVIRVPRNRNLLAPLAGDAAALAVSVAAITDDLRQRCAVVYQRTLFDRPGTVLKDAKWTALTTRDHEDDRDGRSDLRCILLTDAHGVDQAYANYSVGHNSLTNDSTVWVREFVAATPAAYHQVVSVLLNLDLTDEVRFVIAPDEPLYSLLVNERRSKAEMYDSLWVRLVDLPSALSGRTYQRDVDVLIEVRDDMLPANAGVWRFVGGPDGGELTRSRRKPEITLTTNDLGAAYLGEPSLAIRARAGMLVEHRSGAVEELSAAFTSDPRPFMSFGF